MSQVWYLRVRGSLKPASSALEKATALKDSRALTMSKAAASHSSSLASKTYLLDSGGSQHSGSPVLRRGIVVKGGAASARQ